MAIKGLQTQQGDTIKSSFLLTEIVFSITNDYIQASIHEDCITHLYQLVDNQMLSLNTDILALNNSLLKDQLHFTGDNPTVASIIPKLDILSAFVRMILRVLEKISKGGQQT